MPGRPRRIGIVGAGLTGLTAAWDLARAGVDVTVAEQEPYAGGLAATFPYAGTRLEVFYHHLFTSDRDALQLLRELGLEAALEWRQPRMGMYQQGRVYSFATPMDLLRFRPLSFWNRIRFGVMVLYLSQVRNWKKFEPVRAEAWIRRAFGEQAWKVIWGPLLHGKFGAFASSVGMAWFYGRVHARALSREAGMARESLGYLRGSFQTLTDALVQAVTSSGGQVRLGAPIQALELEAGGIAGWRTAAGAESFDAVLVTVAPPTLLNLLPGGVTGEYWEKLRRIQYLGNVCSILTLKRSLSPIYWMNIPDLESPFIAVIEHTNFIPPETYGGGTTLYLSTYCATDHPLYRSTADEVLATHTAYLKKILPAFDPSEVVDRRVFRAPFAQPVVTPEFSQNLVGIPTPVPGLFVANMAQIYPEDRGMNYSIRLGREAARAMLTPFASQEV